MNTKIKVAVLIYNGVELVDMNGPLDAFLHANRYNDNRYDIYTVATNKKTILSEGKIVSINPAYDIHDCPQPDIIVIPGIIDLEVDPAMIAWIKKMGSGKRKITIMSVCIGFFTLAKTGLLNGKQATTHYLSISEAEQDYPDIQMIKNVRYVEDGKFVTTGGITSGIDGALYLIEVNDGAVLAQQVADVMIYNRSAPLPPFTLLPPYSNK